MQDSSGEHNKEHSFSDFLKNPFGRNNNNLPENPSRREFLKKSTQVGVGIAGLATVGAGKDHLTSSISVKAEEGTTPENVIPPDHFCYGGPNNRIEGNGKEGGWSIPDRKITSGGEVLAASQEVGIDTDSEKVHKWFTEANQILHEKWNIPSGLLIYVGVYQDNMIYNLQGQKYEALAITRRNWEDEVPTREAHILLSVNAYNWSDEEVTDTLTHEIGHALKTWYPGEHNPDENSVMYWFFTKPGKPITAKDHESVLYDHITGKEKVKSPTPQPPRPAVMPFKATAPVLTKD